MAPLSSEEPLVKRSKNTFWCHEYTVKKRPPVYDVERDGLSLIATFRIALHLMDVECHGTTHGVVEPTATAVVVIPCVISKDQVFCEMFLLSRRDPKHQRIPNVKLTDNSETAPHHELRWWNMCSKNASYLGHYLRFGWKQNETLHW